MLDYMEALARSTELEYVWKLHCTKMAEFGFDRLVYGYTRFGTEQTIGPSEDALLLSSHEPDYFRRFISDGHYLHAPLYEWAMENSGSRSWMYLREEYEKLNARQRAVIDFNKANGVVAGYSVAFPDASRRARGLMALTARPGLSQSDVNDIWAQDGRTIEAMCNMAHLKIIALPYTSTRPSLTPRQLEVLEWTADGKTNQDIATIMGLSSATIEKHLRLAREKMDVDTTAQAVLKASFQNQMFVVKA